VATLPLLDDMPILYEDEEEGDMGEADPHMDAAEILHICLKAHLAGRAGYRIFSNMNCYYRKDKPHPRTGSLPYVSPDNMVVKPSRDLGTAVSSYTIDDDGPAPVLIAEVLSERSVQQGDLGQKVKLYCLLGVAEYILVDPTGRFLPQRLLLKRLGRNRRWRDEQDADGGVTSRLGFRVIIDTDGRLRLLDAASGRAYIRPDEAEQRIRAESDARRLAEEKVQQLQAQLQRLQAARPKPKKRPGKRRRKS
jgi:Uma2 family endonuclease